MKNSVSHALNALCDCTTQTESLKELIQYVTDHMTELGSALQMIADTDSEQLLDAMHFGLYKVCPVEVEGHVMATKDVYFFVIASAWSEYDQNCQAALEAWVTGVTSDSDKKTKKHKKTDKKFSALPTEPNPSDIEHLKKCFELK